MVSANASKIPQPIKAPNTFTGGIGVNIKEKKPTADVIEVNNIGVYRWLITCLTTAEGLSPFL